MKVVSYRSILEERLGPAPTSVIEEVEPLFQEGICDLDIQNALQRGELPPVADQFRVETRRLLLSLLPATLEELADRIVEFENKAA